MKGSVRQSCIRQRVFGEDCLWVARQIEAWDVSNDILRGDYFKVVDM